MFLCLLLDRYDHRSPSDACCIHRSFRVRIVQENLRSFCGIPFKDQCHVIRIFYIAIKLIDARRASGFAIGFVGIKAFAPDIVISDVDTQLDVNLGVCTYKVASILYQCLVIKRVMPIILYKILDQLRFNFKWHIQRQISIIQKMLFKLR